MAEHKGERWDRYIEKWAKSVPEQRVVECLEFMIKLVETNFAANEAASPAPASSAAAPSSSSSAASASSSASSSSSSSAAATEDSKALLIASLQSYLEKKKSKPK